MKRAPSVPDHWDVQADVVVVGFGAAGAATSVTAHELGAEVVILERAPEGQDGGNTRVAGQGYLNTSSVEDAVAYLTALCGPYTVPGRELIRAQRRGRSALGLSPRVCEGTLQNRMPRADSIC